jgi:hypothetical protein
MIDVEQKHKQQQQINNNEKWAEKQRNDIVRHIGHAKKVDHQSIIETQMIQLYCDTIGIE